MRDADGAEWPYSPYRPFSYPGLDRAPLGESSQEGEAVQRIESIGERSYLKTHTEAIRVALTAYNELLRVDAVGDDILVRDNHGRETLFNPHRPFPAVSQNRETAPA